MNEFFDFLRARLKAVGRVCQRALDGVLNRLRPNRPNIEALRQRETHLRPGSARAKTAGQTARAPQEIRPYTEEFMLGEAIRVYAIGDIHGRADLLVDLMNKIDADSEGVSGEVHLVFLGDYIDRGLQSRHVVDLLLSDRMDRYITHYLKGNHEDAILSFMGDPEFGPRWASYGGRETLVSYGVKPPRSMALSDDWMRAHDAFLKSIPMTHQTFYRQLKTSVRLGGYGFVHAGLRPGRVFAEQDDRDMMWIREEFLQDKSSFDVFVIHGHTPIDSPHRDHRRINVDTGAYFTGRLTAVRLEGNSVEFISTET
ncbi:MAG: metallophosphoesterase family protein [Henriciella sp.]|nr:metallophosphoesterase family protein [Henriciella sp.]